MAEDFQLFNLNLFIQKLDDKQKVKSALDYSDDEGKDDVKIYHLIRKHDVKGLQRQVQAATKQKPGQAIERNLATLYR